MVAMGGYVPTPRDIAWANMMVQSIVDGGSWTVPENQAIYKFNHKSKEIVLVEGPKDYVFERSKIVFGQIGYKVVDGRKTTN